MARVLLIQPPAATRNKGGSFAEPIGLEYVASMLQSQGHEVPIVDAWVDGLDHEAVGQQIRRHAPDVVGITATSVLVPNAWWVAQQVKEGKGTDLMPAAIEAARVEATLGEMQGVLKEVFGWGYTP